jgi:Ca2+-binding RTX toxin-like protein
MTINSEVLSILARASHDSYGSVEIGVTGYEVTNRIEDASTGFSLTLYKNESSSDYIFAFGGTESAQDVFADLTLGVNQWSEENKTVVWELITGISAGNSDVKLHFVGHSLGGALAQYLAYEYAQALADPENTQNLQASFDLVTFNALGGVLALSDPELSTTGYDPTLASTINAAHYKIAGDLVSRLGDDHVGGDLLVIDKYLGSPFWSHDIAHFTTGVPGNYPVALADYENAAVEDDYLDIKQPVHVSGIMASWGDDGVTTEEEALLRTISAFAFGLANAQYGELGALVTAFFGDPSTIGQEKYDALLLIGETAIIALQSNRAGFVAANAVGAYALSLANILQFSTQLWEEHPEFADALGMSIETFIDRVGRPAIQLSSAALDYALEFEFIAEEYQDAVDFITNAGRWIGSFFSSQPVNGMYIQGTEADDVLTTRDSYWPWKSNDDQIFGYAGDDVLEGGEGNDFLVGGAGADTYIWNTGDASDTIGDFDDGADKIVVNGVNLAELDFKRVSTGSPFYRDAAQPDISLHYDGAFLTVTVGGDNDGGTITVKEYLPVTGADFGIILRDYEPDVQVVTDVAVGQLGTGADDIDSSAYWRQQAAQGGLDWSATAIRFNANDVINYSGGALHGTSGGAFEGGPVADYLSGDADANALHGLAGADTLEGGGGDDFLEGGAGSDALAGGDGNDILFGGARAGLAAALDSGSAQDQFYLQQIGDVAGTVNELDAGAGDDYVSGGQHSDYIAGGSGSDYLLGGTGNDAISGGDNRDVIYGDSSLHYRYLELSPGVVTGQLEIAFAGGADPVAEYDDELRAGPGDDIVWGELGDDALYGGDGNDNLYGDRVNDPEYFSAELPAYGSTSSNLAIALHGDDRLYGEGGADVLMGHGGNDLLAGGAGDDSLLGGEGDDIYLFQPGGALDLIQDSQGIHTLVFSNTDAGAIQVLFQGDQVRVGPGAATEGFSVSRDQWSSVRIALDSPDTLIDSSRLDTYYADSAGNRLFSVLGNAELSDADRDALFTVDTTDPDKPGIAVSAGVETIEIQAIGGGSQGAVMRIGNGALQLVVELAARQIASGFDFLSIADGTIMNLVGFSGQVSGSQGADLIIGTDLVDVIRAGNGDDAVEARGGNDSLYGDAGNDLLSGESGDDFIDGGQGRDLLRGGPGRDQLYGGQSPERDYLEGGVGDDVLDGAYGPDTYILNRGDGRDLLHDPDGYHYFEFGAAVDPQSVVLNYTDTTDSAFRLEYAPGDAVSSTGISSAHWINGVTVDGIAIPLVQRSDLDNGSFHDTRWHDIFEGGAGDDTVFAAGWGEDVYRFSAGDGRDTIKTEHHFYPELMGEISFSSDVDLNSLSFSFHNGTATIAYGESDQVTLDTDRVFSLQGNVIGLFTLVSEANPDWVPLIQAQGYVGHFYGSYGADHIIGGDNIETILPGYGDDIIEAGDGADSIVLNDTYVYQGGGIGHKQISGNPGNDTVLTPLHQGLSFHYQLGDGHDSIEYDWSFSSMHPYAFGFDPELNSMALSPYGQDVLAFGEGISLADLRFIRSDNALDVSLRDGSGSIHLPEFFHAWEVDAPVGPPEPPMEGQGPTSLLDPLLIGLLPRSPLATISFADGSSYDMATVLDALLEVPATGELIVGTRGKDLLLGTQGDDTLMGKAGRDTIIGAAGNDTIIGGKAKDSLSGGLGDDSYIFAAGDGRDLIDNDDTDLQGVDSLRLEDLEFDRVWLSRSRKHLVVTIAGSEDRVRINDWFVNEADQLDAIYAGDRVLMRDQVDQLVSAMAAFDVPRGVGAIISEPVREVLAPTLASVWQLTG